MKKFFTAFALAAALIFTISCGGGSSKEGDNTDTGETVTDDDTVDTEPTGDPEPTVDTEPADDTDTQEKPDEDTPSDDWRERAEECEKLGGYFHGATETCRKYIDCPEKPELTEWNGDDVFHIEYKDGAWEEREVATEYNEEKGECHFVCDSDFDLVWTGTKCEEFCFLKCNDVENTYTYFCDHTKGSETYTCYCSDGYEWNAEKKTCDSVCEEGYYYREGLAEPCVKDGCLNAVCGEHSDGICVREDFDDAYHCGCEENYYWNYLQMQCMLEPCLQEGICGEHSDGICVRKNDSGFYTCGCDEGYYWTGEQCLEDPCLNAVCGEHSDGICIQYGSSDYECGCDENYYWDMLELKCLLEPCLQEGICGEHSNGNCVRDNGIGWYHCGCDENYYWNTGELKCLPEPCLTVVCGEHSDGNCVRITDSGEYLCGCETHYAWNSSQKKCIPDPCKNPDPCENMANANSCIKLSDTTFECACDDGFSWSGSQCL